MLRGTTTAVSLEQTTDATGAVTQQQQMQQPVVVLSDRVLLLSDNSKQGRQRVDGVNVESIALEAAQLYPFATEQRAAEAVGESVGLPLDPLDPTWGKPSDRDRTLVAGATPAARTTTTTAVSDFGIPSRLAQSPSEQLLSIGTGGDGGVGGLAGLTMMAADGERNDRQPSMLIAGGLLAFVVVGVIVNRVRRFSSSNIGGRIAAERKRIEASDAEKAVFDSDDDDAIEEGYALLS